MASRILIVEDERITAEDLHDILTEMGYLITAIVSSGDEAIREAERNPPDLALMDIRIKGDMDGTETARILGERFDIPVVYLTAHADRDTLQRAKRAKPLGYIVKPFQESELQASVEIALHKHQQDKKDRDRQQHLTDLLSALILGIISVDQSEIVLVFNPAAEDLTGFQKDEAVGGSVHKVFRLADSQSGQAVDLPLAQVLGNRTVAELNGTVLLHKAGARNPISGSISPVRGPDGGSIGAVIVFEQARAKSGETVLSPTLEATDQGTEIQFGRFHMLAHSEEMKRVLAFAVRVARSEASTILLEGESGTGKDILAQFLHYSSTRRAGPFVPVNCSAIPEHLIESELFGHERGAFIEAKEDKKGLFQIADGGTLFLDEIGDLSPAMQAKLLRVLEEKRLRRLGSTQDVDVDVRVIGATNRLLANHVQSGEFRLDLFHRLSIIQILLPPLRDRPSDILPLARHFIQHNNAKYRGKVEGISEESARLLEEHSWPGNVRELRNVIERAALVEETKVIQPASIHFVALPSQPVGAPAGMPVKETWSLSESELSLVVRALEKTGGNQSRAAKLLGITRDMLRYRMKKMKLKVREDDYSVGA